MGWLDTVACNLVREGMNSAFPPPRRGRGGSSGCLVFFVAMVGVGVIAHLFR